MMAESNQDRTLSPEQKEQLLKTLKSRFEKNMARHPGLDWTNVQSRLDQQPEKLWSISEMERTGGEPDLVGDIGFVDCSAETPKDRRSLCYDRAALDSRKEHKPKDSVVDMAAAMGVELLDEEEYRALQEVGEFDLKTSSWLLTPPEIRALGGAIFGDRRYDRVFVFHNGADSYYASRAFRGVVRI